MLIDQDRLEQILQTIYDDELHNNNKTITIDYQILHQYYQELAEQLLTDYKYTHHEIQKTINKLKIQNQKKTLQIRNVTPITPINQIHSDKRGTLVSTEGTIKKVTNVYNQITRVSWKCNNCQTPVKFKLGYDDKITPPKTACEGCGKNKGYTIDTTGSTFKDIQKFTLQENLEHVERGFKPVQITGLLENNQINTLKPGDKIRVNGIVELRNQKKQNVFKEYLLTEHVEQLSKEFEDIIITQDDEKHFKEYVQSHDIFQEFKKIVAPTLDGYDEVKEAIILQLFSSQTTKNTDGTNNRGDIHILLIGDPGIGKSQILKSISEIVPRGIYTSGKSSSGAGLTATAVKDDNDSWTLEAGAMVLADKGMVCIDEFDKMREEDRSSIHEALEQQTISMAKAGNITTMYSRCSVLAAANPKYGSFDEYKSIPEQINLSPTLLSRFDLIFILKDKQDMEQDELVALSILESSTVTSSDSEQLDYKKYISYARKQLNPTITDESKARLVKFYKDWRNSAKEDNDSLPVTARQFMGLVRLSLASARARLSEEVTLEDVERAIRLENYCINHNGYSVDPSSPVMKVEDKLDKFKEYIPLLADEYNNKIPGNVMMRKADEYGITRNDCQNWLYQMDETGWIVYDPELGEWSLRNVGV